MPAVQDSINAIRVAAEAADRIKATDIVLSTLPTCLASPTS